MKLLAVNGSPRKKWNAAQLLAQVVAGARENGAEAELIHLRDYRDMWDEKATRERHAAVFPQELEKAFALGGRLVS